MATTSVQRTPGVTGNRKTWTFSAWFKRGDISVDNDIFGYDVMEVILYILGYLQATPCHLEKD